MPSPYKEEPLIRRETGAAMEAVGCRKSGVGRIKTGLRSPSLCYDPVLHRHGKLAASPLSISEPDGTADPGASGCGVGGVRRPANVVPRPVGPAGKVYPAIFQESSPLERHRLHRLLQHWGAVPGHWRMDPSATVCRKGNLYPILSGA